jgi:ribosome-associated translation inhibitor RaiA
MRKSDNAKRNSLRENVIHVGAGFVAKERPHVIQTLSTLEAHLGRWDPNDVNIEVTLQDRGGKEQRITLRTTLPGHPVLVAVADNPDITRALGDAKRELIRQLEHQKSTHDPMNNRRLRRATIRHPVTSAPFEVGPIRNAGPTPNSSSLQQADRCTTMTNTTETHSIAIPAKERMTPPTESAISLIDHGPLTIRDVLRAGMRRRARRKEMAAQSIWDSEGGHSK